MRFNVYGKIIEVLKRQNKYQAYYLGQEGKKRFAHDIVIPADMHESGITGYLADLCHEWATPQNNSVRLID